MPISQETVSKRDSWSARVPENASVYRSLTNVQRATEPFRAGRGRARLTCECLLNASREVAIASSPTSTLSPKKNRSIPSISSGSCAFRRNKSAMRVRAKRCWSKPWCVFFRRIPRFVSSHPGLERASKNERAITKRSRRGCCHRSAQRKTTTVPGNSARIAQIFLARQTIKVIFISIH